MTLGDYIYNKRTQQGMSQEELGEAVGVQKSTVAKWENEKIKSIRSDTLIKLADAFGVDAKELFDLQNVSNNKTNKLVTVNDRLRTAIENSRMSLGDLEVKTGIYKSAISRYVNGTTTKIPLDRLAKLSNALNVSLASLTGLEELNGGNGNNVDAKVSEINSETGNDSDAVFPCKDDCMLPTIQKGDQLCTRIQPDVEDGQIAMISLDNVVSARRVHHTPSGYILVCDNVASYRPVLIDTETDKTFRIIGLVTGLKRTIR